MKAVKFLEFRTIERPNMQGFGVALYRRIGLRLLIGFACAMSAMVFFAWLATEVLQGSTAKFDDEMRTIVHQHSSPALTSFMRAVTMFGSASVLILLGLCAMTAFLVVGWRRGIILLAVTMTGAALLNQTLKLTFLRLRPVPFFDIPIPGSYSFPSGHALNSLCFYGALAAIIAGRTHSRVGHVVIWIFAVLLVVLTGFSRVYLGVHYPSDVLAGYAAALVWLSAVGSADHVLQRTKSQPAK